MKHTLHLNNLSTGYGKTVITEGIDATLNQSELTCMLGPNGAGKSTLLKTISSFIRPISGEILYNGTDLKKYGSKQLSQLISVVLTERPTATNMTVRELVALGRSPYTGFWGSLKGEDADIVDEAIKNVGIESLRDRKISTLSDGERQKAMIAKALAQATPIIILDEPTAFLDYPSKVEIMQLLYRITKEENKTVFMSTHDIDISVQIADKIWLLDDALGLKIGMPEDLAYSGDLSRYFSSESLAFDESDGHFHVVHGSIGKVRVTGVGRLRPLVEMALKRVGYDIDSDADIDIDADIDSDSNAGNNVAAEGVVEIKKDERGEEEIYFCSKRCRNIEELIDTVKARKMR